MSPNNTRPNPFKPAIRSSVKLRLSIDGPGGAGKTHSALILAAGMSCKNIFGIDTEHGSMALEAGKPNIPPFQHTILTEPYSPERYLDLCYAAVFYGADMLIIDSLSHAWSGTGGMLDEKENRLASGHGSKDSFRVWAQMTPRQTWFLNSLLALDCHLIVTMRTKTAWEMQTDPKTLKLKPVKIGLKPDQREDVDYLFTVSLNMSPYGHFAYCSKDRTDLFDGREFVPSYADGENLRNWLNSDLAHTSNVTSVPTQQVPTKPKAEMITKGQHGILEEAITNIATANGLETKYFRDRVKDYCLRKFNIKHWWKDDLPGITLKDYNFLIQKLPDFAEKATVNSNKSGATCFQCHEVKKLQSYMFSGIERKVCFDCFCTLEERVGDS